MSLNRCAHCTTLFSIGAEHCPQCGNADFYEEGSMAKISRHLGPTYAGTYSPGATELPDGSVHTAEVAAEFGGEEAVDPADVSPYDGLLRTDLQELLRARDLPTSGNKEELVARLVADDAKPEDEAETDEPAEDEDE